MNKARRAALEKISATLSQAAEELRDIQCEEQEAFDNLPESLQSGERGEAMESAASEMQEVVYNLEDAAQTLNNLI